MPTLFTFIIDAIRLGDESWLDEDHVRAYAPMGGMDQISAVSDFIKDDLGIAKGRLGYEDGMATYTAEGNLTHYEYTHLTEALPGFDFVNAHEIIDTLSIIKDQGTINRFRKASLIVDEGHKAARAALENGGYQGNDRGGHRRHRRPWPCARPAAYRNGISRASTRSLADTAQASAPARRPPPGKSRPGEPLMLDFHAMFQLALGDHSHNYLIAPATARQRWHADNFVALVQLVLDNYRAGVTPAELAQLMMDCAETGAAPISSCPGCEHGIGLFGDEWRIGARIDGPMPYWTDPDHTYRENEMVDLRHAVRQPGRGDRLPLRESRS